MPATEAAGDLSSPVDEGSTSTRQDTDRAAQKQRGTDGTGKIAFEPITPQILPIDEHAAALMQSRRFAMLQAFMRAARFIVRPFLVFRRRRKTKGRARQGGRGGDIRKRQFRADKKAAAIARLKGKKPESGAPSRASATINRPPPTPCP